MEASGQGHMNVYRSYEYSVPHHEDRMTRALLIVLRLVPLALEAFVDRAREDVADRGLSLPAGLAGPSRLGPPTSVETQTARLYQGEKNEVGMILSVFLSPDDSVEFQRDEFEPSERTQRLDGVIRFGDDFVIAIESKLHEGASPYQSEAINLEGYDAEFKPIAHVCWHEFLEDLLQLSERGLLNWAENGIVEDLFWFAEEWTPFQRLLPFTTLKRCNESPFRIQRRLRSLLGEVTGFNLGATKYAHGWNYMIPGPQSCSEVGLWMSETQLNLTVWPGQQVWQSRNLLGRPETLAAINTAGHGPTESDPAIAGWTMGVRPHIGSNHHHKDLHPAEEADFEAYLENAETLFRMVGQHSPTEFNAGVKQPLLDMGLASGQDEGVFEVVGSYKKPVFRAAGWVSRNWNREAAAALDEDGLLEPAIRAAAVELFEVVGESAARDAVIRHHRIPGL